MDVHGKVAVVTGASGGIGLAVAKVLAGKGAKLALVARSKDKLEALAKEMPQAIAVPADMTKTDEIKSMIKAVQGHFGKSTFWSTSPAKDTTHPSKKQTSRFSTASLTWTLLDRWSPWRKSFPSCAGKAAEQSLT